MTISDDAIRPAPVHPASLSLPPTLQVDLTWLWADLHTSATPTA